MIRLLEIFSVLKLRELGFQKLETWRFQILGGFQSLKGGRRHERHSTSGNASRPEVHLQNVKQSDRLLAGGARIHVDFHADRHFDDLWGLPGHFGSPSQNRTTTVLAVKLLPD
jgi:hypothetical protein